MKIVLAVAALGLSVAGAQACDYLRSADAKTDPTVVASVTSTQTSAMSTADDALPPLVDERATPPVVAK